MSGRTDRTEMRGRADHAEVSGRTDDSGPDHPIDWFGLIRPSIDVEPDDATHDDVRTLARRHARQVAERSLLSVEHDAIEWRPTRALKTVHGRHTVRDGRSVISLSLDSLARNGWESTMETVRHELVHRWQHENDGFDEGRTRWERAHGPSFERWMAILDVEKRTEARVADHRYVIRCPVHGPVARKHRECKTTKATRSGRNWCTACGESAKGKLRLVVDGRTVATATTPDAVAVETDLTQLKGVDESMATELVDAGIGTLSALRRALLSPSREAIEERIELRHRALTLAQLGLENAGGEVRWRENAANRP